MFSCLLFRNLAYEKFNSEENVTGNTNNSIFKNFP